LICSQPPVLAPTVLVLVLRNILKVRVAKIAGVTRLWDLVHCDQKETKRQRLEDNVKANLLFLELTLLQHRLKDERKPNYLLMSLHPQGKSNQIWPLMLPIIIKIYLLKCPRALPTHHSSEGAADCKTLAQPWAAQVTTTVMVVQGLSGIAGTSS
jgi:hypothetical protein